MSSSIPDSVALIPSLESVSLNTNVGFIEAKQGGSSALVATFFFKFYFDFRADSLNTLFGHK